MNKKITKIVLKTFVIIVTIFFVGLLILRKMYPPDKLKAMAITEIETALQRPVTISDIWFNPLKGFLIDDIIIYEKQSPEISSADSNVFFSTKRITLNYNIFSLINREIKINKILVDRPSINLVQFSNQQWNFQDLIEFDTLSADRSMPPETMDTTRLTDFSLPVTLDLKELSIKNITANLSISQATAKHTLKSGGITIDIRDFYFPRKPVAQIKNDIRGKLNIQSDQMPWEISFASDSSQWVNELQTKLILDMNWQVQGIQNVSSTSSLGLADVVFIQRQQETSEEIVKKFPLSQLLAIEFDLSVDADNGFINVKQFATKLSEQTIFDIQGEIRNIFEQPDFDLSVVDSRVDLHQLLTSVTPMLPDTLLNELDKITVDGILTLEGTKFTGNPLSTDSSKSLAMGINLDLKNGNFRYLNPETELSNVNINVNGSGSIDSTGIKNSAAQLFLSIDRIFSVVDTSSYEFTGLETQSQITLNQDFFPASFNLNSSIENFFEVPINLTASFKSLDKFNRFDAAAELSFDELPLSKPTNAAVNGVVDFLLKCQSNSLEKIDVSLELLTDILEVQTETDEPMILYPIDIFGDFTIATDTTFQQFRLKTLKLSLSDFAKLKMFGQIGISPDMRASLTVEEFKLDHENVFAYIPPQLLEGLADLTVSGNTILQSQIDIIFPQDEMPIIRANGELFLKAGADYPSQFISVKSFDSYLDFRFDNNIAYIKLNAALDSTILAQIDSKPIPQVKFDLSAKLIDFETAIIESGGVSIPDFKTNFFLTGRVDSLSGNMQATAKSNLTIDTQQDTVTIFNMVSLTGRAAQNLEMSFKDNLVDASGSIYFSALNVFDQDLFALDSLNGRIQFSQKLNIETGRLIPRNEKNVFLVDAGTYYYDVMRPYYLKDQKEYSHFSIKKIEIMDYLIENVNVDLYLHNERIDIPRFSLNLYDGNMSGLMLANLHDGDLNQIEWKIKTNISRLNSAKLLPKSTKGSEKSDLNLNMELLGTGLNPAEVFEVSGYLYVTKIGPKFTDNFLKALDPKRTDKSIQDTRKLLNWGYKPKLLSFEIKHDNLYPSIHLVKGNILTKLIPLNISGGKIELARIPVKFFLSNMNLEKQYQ